MATTGIDVFINGRWLALDAPYGDVQMSTVWPGGSDEMSWTIPGTYAVPTAGLFFGGALVTGFFGGIPVWSGQLTQPDPSQDRMVARGSWRSADDFAALDGSGNATTVPDTAIDQAIARGIGWSRPTSVSAAAQNIDVTQGPVTVGAVLDAWTVQANSRWGVNARNQVVNKADETTPTYRTEPLENGLGYARDTYASTLIGRYKTSVGFATAIQTDTSASARFGYVETVVDLTPRGVLTSTQANSFLANLLALGRAIPQWQAGLALSYGELLTTGGIPVALESVAAGNVLRIPTGFDMATRLNGAMALDVLIGQTQLAEGTLTLTPIGVAARNLADVLTVAIEGKVAV